jgi:hypothetical protein
MVPGHLLDLSWGHREGVDTSGSENETHLVAGGRPGHLTSVGQSALAAWDTQLSCIVCAGLETACGDNT